eukprot:g906.t1
MPQWKLSILRVAHLFVTLLMLLTLSFLLLGAVVFCSSAVSDNAEAFWEYHLWSHVTLSQSGNQDSVFNKIMFDQRAGARAVASSAAPLAKPASGGVASPLTFSLEWDIPVGCDWSGFFVEGLGFGVGLSNILGDGAFSLSVGDCAPEMLSQLTPREARILSRQTSASTTAHDFHAIILHKRPGSDFTLTPSRRAAADLVVGRMMTESAKLPLRESRQVEYVDEVWVPTHWHRSVFEQAGIDPVKIRVVPEPVDTAFFDPEKVSSAFATSPAAPQSDEITRFVSVFKWERRKGWDILLDAYWSAFDRGDPVELRIRTYKPSWEPGTKDIDSIIEQHARSFLNVQTTATVSEQNARHLLPAVRWEKRELSRRELREFYHNASAFVLPTRGEGWCLPAVEAMSMALPVIVTNFSGPSAYIRPGHAYSIGVAAALNKDGTAEPLITDLIASFRRVAARPREASMVGVRARRWVQTHLSTEVVARRVKENIMSSLQQRVEGEHVWATDL